MQLQQKAGTSKPKTGPLHIAGSRIAMPRQLQRAHLPGKRRLHQID